MTSFRGHPLINNAAPILAEYNARKRLADLGFTSDLSSLDCVKAEAFIVISQELDRLQAEEYKRKKK